MNNTYWEINPEPKQTKKKGTEMKMRHHCTTKTIPPNHYNLINCFILTGQLEKPVLPHRKFRMWWKHGFESWILFLNRGEEFDEEKGILQMLAETKI